MRIQSIIGATCAWLLFISCTTATASVVYKYTGNAYDTFFNQTSYTADMSVIGVIELATPLGRSVTTQVSPLSFSFFDGINTITSANATGNTRFVLTTDHAGHIADWEIELFYDTEVPDGFVYRTIGTWHDGLSGWFDLGGSECSTQLFCPYEVQSEYASATIEPGSWAVPSPSALWLFGTGLLGLIGVARRKIRV